MASTFHCVVATPTRKLFDGDVYYASVPGCEGSYGVMAGHELMVALNTFSGVCSLHLDEAGAEKREFFISEGATQMYNGMLTVLGRFGKDVNDIDAEVVQKRIDELRQEIEQIGDEPASAQDEVELASHDDRLRWCEAQLAFLNKSGN